MTQAQKKAHKRYETKRQIKPISLNTETEKDLLDFANSVDFGNWVKDKIREELKHQNDRDHNL